MKTCPTCRTCYEDAEAACVREGHGPLAPSRPGARLVDGKYRLDRLLGRGGMGAVYAGLHVELERPVAVKLLLPDLVRDPAAPGRFRREARAAARLNHPHVAGVYDFGTLPGGESYIIMELVEGETLRERLAAAGALPLREAVLIARQVADGVESAHRGGVVHRDLKPSNVVVSRDHRGDPFVKVLDFGVAKLTGHPTGRLDAARAGAIVGTPRYMSPEQCADHVVDARSDVYSLGVILYEMIAGRPPFDAPSATAVALMHIQEPPPPLEDARPDVPGGLSRLVARALAKDPADRPQTAAELSSALRAFEEMEEASGLMASTPPEPSPPKGLREDERDGGGAVDPTSSVSTSQAATAASTFDEGLPESSPEPGWRRRLPLALAATVVFFVSAVGAVLFLTWRGQPAHTARNTAAPTATQSPAPAERAPEASGTQPVAEASPTPTPMPTSTPEKKEAARAPEADKKALESALNAWVAATNSRDLGRQLSYYAPRLEVFYLSRNVSRDAVMGEKKSTTGRAARVSITVANPAVEFGRDGLTAVMTFRKRYVIESGGKRRGGEVVQELRWSRARPNNQEWKITGERDLKVIR